MDEYRQKIYDNRYKLLFYALFFTALCARLWQFGQHPAGLNQDEASIGYDAYALMRYGMDRNGNTLPVHLIAWGSGQNALYAYLSMPFISLFGLNAFSVRIVNLLFALISLPAMYFGIKSRFGRRSGAAAMALLAISPWNIMLSRWGLESNLFPSLLIIAFWLVMTCDKSKKRLFAAAVTLAACLYAYGAAYLVITVFIGLCGLAYIIGVRKKLSYIKRLPVKRVAAAAVIYAILSLPIYLFMIINVFGLDTINLGVMTIPHTYGGRIASSAGATPISAVKNFVMLCILQTDGAERNSIPFFGCFYIISLPFTVLGMIRKSSRKASGILLFFLLAATVMLFAFYGEPNINRVNAVYVPLIIFTAFGIEWFWKKRKTFAAICLVYVMCFSGFLCSYFDKDYKDRIGTEFYESFDKAIIAADNLRFDDTPIQVCTSINMPYIYTLFYTYTDPRTFVDTVEYYDPNSQFRYVLGFDGWRFNIVPPHTPTTGIYIVENVNLDYIMQFTNEVYVYKNYTVAIIR